MNRTVNEIILCNTAWWIVSRRQTWGPFDYQWSTDLRGVEFTFQGSKFGEVCGKNEFFADLAPFRIPISVCRAAAIVAGSIAISISMAEDSEARASRISETLGEYEFGRFVVRISDRFPEEIRPRSQDT